MLALLKTITGQSQTTARVVDGKLILSLPEAIKPVVWQMELGDAKASALEVQDDTQNNRYALCLKTPRGEAAEIAVFAKRSQAIGSLMETAKALQDARGQIQSRTETMSQPVQIAPAKKGGALAASILGVCLLLVLLFVWNVIGNTHAGSTSIAPSSVTPSAATENGVPLSADEFLKGR